MIKNILTLLLLAFPIAAQTPGNLEIGSYRTTTWLREQFNSLRGWTITPTGGATVILTGVNFGSGNTSSALWIKLPAGTPGVGVSLESPPRAAVPRSVTHGFTYELDIMQSKDPVGQTYSVDIEIIADPACPCGPGISFGGATGASGTWARTHGVGVMSNAAFPLQIYITVSVQGVLTAPVEILIGNIRVWDEVTPTPQDREFFVWNSPQWEVGQTGAQVNCVEPNSYQNPIFLLDGALNPVGLPIPGVFGEYWLTSNAIPIMHTTSGLFNVKTHAMPSPGLTIPNISSLINAPLYLQGFAVADPSAVPPPSWPQLFTRPYLVYIVDPTLR